MSRCSVCSQWFILGDNRVSQDGKAKHKKCEGKNLSLQQNVMPPQTEIATTNQTHSTVEQLLQHNSQPISDQVQQCEQHIVERLLPPETNDPPEAIQQVLDNWNCVICTLQNEGSAVTCGLCRGSRDAVVPVRLEREDEDRWACLVCTLSSNHPLASFCAACGSNRGQVLLDPLKPAEQQRQLEFSDERFEIRVDPPDMPYAVDVGADVVVDALDALNFSMPSPGSTTKRTPMTASVASPKSFSMYLHQEVHDTAGENDAGIASLDSYVDEIAGLLPLSPSRATPTITVKSAQDPVPASVNNMNGLKRPVLPMAPSSLLRVRNTVAAAPLEALVPALQDPDMELSQVRQDGGERATAPIPLPDLPTPLQQITAAFPVVLAEPTPEATVKPAVVLCVSCDAELSEHNEYKMIAGCAPHCKDCLGQWINSQILSGNAMKLKCLCGAHNIRYIDVQGTARWISGPAQAIYTTALRDNSTAALQREAACPECTATAHYDEGQPTYTCLNRQCRATVCTLHNVMYARPKSKNSGLKILSAAWRCERCEETASAPESPAEVLAAIQNAFTDRCPSCHGAVGEPSTFDDCMALKCNHCGVTFCGFCYNFASDWTRAHAHVRKCKRNPRHNYFAESEEIWRDLMRQRRVALAEAILLARAVSFTPEEVESIRTQYLALL